MLQVNIYEAKTHLSALVDRAYRGSPFIIARSGHPLVNVEAYEEPAPKTSKIGVMSGRMKVPDDIKSIAADEIADLFEGKGA